MDYRSIDFSLRDGVATLVLSRPARLNAFTAEMHAEIRDAMDRVEAPDSGARVLVLTGAGRAFSAGQDLSESDAGAAPLDVGATLERNYNPLLARLRALPIPVVAAVNGVAAGAAANLALACDIVIAARSASFLQAFAKIALIPDAGGTYTLPRLAGLPRAMGMAMLAEPVKAEDAERWGMIWKCVDDADFPAAVEQLAAKLAAGPTGAYARIRRALLASPDNDFDTQMALELALQREAGAQADFAEGVHAFLEKRPPRFSGR
ncbi:MAG: 2-(1,2-epoxy-1,2-dihydrophenyl)acetyl-CoA isomerase PaaG [Burkholderiales bacterium]|nr:2-(1,2-epoxy-1,2-dihydrophenyl)acetyl-CoA isomerase PaaG [Burkholderiales bacterium]